MERNSRRKKRSSFGNLCIVLLSFIVILLSIFSIKKVIIQLGDVNIDNNVRFGSVVESSSLSVQNKGEIFIEDEIGTKYKKKDGSFARDEWIDISEDLYRFNEDGYAYNTKISENGQIFTFEKGKLTNITIDSMYQGEAGSKLFSSTSSDEYVVFLAKEEGVDNYFPIVYQHKEIEKSQNNAEKILYLGGLEKKQYASPYLVQIDSNYIYYLCLGEDNSFCGMVNKMRMNATIKETFGKKIEGFIAKCGGLWYCEDGKVSKAKKGNKEGISVNKAIQNKILPLEETTVLYIPGIDAEEDFIVEKKTD